MLPLVGLYGYNFRNQNTIDISNDKQPLSEEYAIHLAQEYCHVVGYYQVLTIK